MVSLAPGPLWIQGGDIWAGFREMSVVGICGEIHLPFSLKDILREKAVRETIAKWKSKVQKRFSKMIPFLHKSIMLLLIEKVEEYTPCCWWSWLCRREHLREILLLLLWVYIVLKFYVLCHAYLLSVKKKIKNNLTLHCLTMFNMLSFFLLHRDLFCFQMSQDDQLQECSQEHLNYAALICL